jgi:nucleotide-binding universal stress UspA family protein
MKNILVPVDYSECSRNAAVYAADLTHTYSSTLVFYNAYHILAQISRERYLTSPEIEMHQQALDELSKFTSPAVQRSAQRKARYIADGRDVIDGIVKAAEESQAELIVMGINGERSRNRLIPGSNAISCARNSDVPVFVIPQQAKFQNIEKITLACDFASGGLTDYLHVVKKLTDRFSACINIVTVVKKHKDTEQLQEVIDRMNEANHWRRCSYSTHFITSVETEEGLSRFIKESKADVLALMPHQRTWFERIFSHSTTRQMAFNCEIPILAIPRSFSDSKAERK